MRFLRHLCFVSVFVFIFTSTYFNQSVFAVNVSKTVPVIHRQCPSVSKNAIKESLMAFNKARAMGLDNKNILTIVDFTKSSDNQRFCTVNLRKKYVLFNTLVSHGKNSGYRFPKAFSNKVGSHKSSVGLFLTGKPYVGKAGYSLHLRGLDKGINDHAFARHVVLHGTKYVNKRVAKHRHRVGRSLGCFGLSVKVAKRVINTVKGGTLIFAYYPAANLLNGSIYLKKV